MSIDFLSFIPYNKDIKKNKKQRRFILWEKTIILLCLKARRLSL